MEKKHFTPNSPGRLASIPAQTKGGLAFVPNDMPPTWSFDDQLWPLLVEAKEAVGTLNGIGQTLPNPHLLLSPLQNREAISSSSIEGTYVTPEQLLMYELDPREPKVGDEKMADWREVFNYSQALRHGCRLLETLPICNRVIKEMHNLLMEGVRGRDKSPGSFRKWQVQIGSTARFVPAPARDVERLMDNLELYVNADDFGYDPLVRSFIVHYQFETIHPFADGNGRVGRALLALMIYKWLGHSMPWLYLSAYFERFRDEYVANLFKISTEGAWSEWVAFCLRGTIVQANDSIWRCNRFNALRTDFHNRIASPSARTHGIIEGLFTLPVVSIASLAKELAISYPTAKIDVDKLLQAGILEEQKDSHPRSFYSPELMHIAFSEPEVVGIDVSPNEPEPPSEQSVPAPEASDAPPAHVLP